MKRRNWDAKSKATISPGIEMNKILESIYSASPAFFQELCINAYASNIHFERFGKKFRELSEYWDKTQWFSYSQLTDLQNEHLRILIKHAYETVPYYNQTMKERKLSPQDFKSIEDLQKLPTLSREDVRVHGSELISRAFSKWHLRQGHTSGTTGSPLQFYWDKNMCLINNVADWRQKNWAGVRYGEKYAVLLGRTIVPIHQSTPPFWRMNYLHNVLWLSSFHMTEPNMQFYMKKLESFKPVALEGYPSTVFILAKYLESQNRTLPLKAVITSSETLHDVQRETIEKVFCCRVFDFYTLAERTIFATECEQHSGHHINMEYGVVEVLNDSGDCVPVGTMGRLVGTTLHNFGMPFIRYVTSDVSSILMQGCSCKRHLPLMADVTTKAEDIIVTKDGRFISPSVLTHPFKPLHSVQMSQIIQEDYEHTVVKIVRRSDYCDADTKRLISALQQRLGPTMKLEIQFVESIPRTSAGKFRWVVSHVPVKFS